MDTQNLALLQSAEALFTEFCHSATTNQRKSAIELELFHLLNDPKHWRFWVDSVAASQNQFLVTQCLNLLSDFVANFWITWASSDQKEYIKSSLLRYLDQAPSPLPNFIVIKLIKLLVDIGKNDWPVRYPDFFAHVEELIRQPRTASLGLRMLKLITEEFVNPKEDIRLVRKEELKNGLNARIPGLFHLLLEVVGPFLDVLNGKGTTMPLDDGRVLIARCVEAVQVLNQILGWIPAKYSLPPALLTALFSFANCDPDNLDLYELATLSLSCIGEISGKTCPNPDMEKTLWTVYEFAFVKLEKVSQDLQGMTELSDSSAEFFQQFIEVLRPLLVNHLQRFESHQNFPTMNFLERFFHFTFHIPAFDLFLSCVDIWNDFLDRILAVTSTRASSSRAAILTSYSAPISALVDRLLMKIQLQHNLAQLEELSEELRSPVDGVSERDDYFDRCIGVVIKAGEILPKEVLEKLVGRFSELQQVFGRILACLQTVSSGLEKKIVLMIEKKSEIRHLHCILRDVGIMSCATARNCGLLTGDLYPVYSDRVIAVVQVLLQDLHFFSDSLNCGRNFHAHAPLVRDFHYLHGCLYRALESLFPWLTQFYSIHVHGSTDGLMKLVAAVVKTCLDPIFSEAESSVSLASSRSLCSLTKMIRIPGMTDLEPVQTLYRQLTEPSQKSIGIFRFFWNLPQETQINLICSLSNILTLPGLQPQNGDEKRSEERAAQHALLIAALTERYRALSPGDEVTLEVVEMVKSTLGLLDGLLLHCSEDPKKSRQTLLASLMPVLNNTVLLLPVYEKNAQQRSAVLHFVLNVFRSLKSTFPPELTSPLSDLFEGLFSQFLDPDELLHAFRSSDLLHVESLSTCFDLLKLVVCDPAYKSYLPMVIVLCHIVCPALQTMTDIRMEFRTASYELLLGILTHHWTYFFRSVRMVAATNGDTIETSLKEETTEAKDFLVILQCLGAALVQPEISLTQLVFDGLNQLHKTREIFAKSPFQQFLRSDYLNALLTMLVQRDKQLLSDDMYLTLFNVVSVDVDFFYRTYLMTFLERWPALDAQQRQRLLRDLTPQSDQVQFTEQLKSLVCEIRCLVVYHSIQR